PLDGLRTSSTTLSSVAKLVGSLRGDVDAITDSWWTISPSPSFVTASSPFSECRLRSISPRDHLSKELLYVVTQEIGLFESREVPPFWHPAIVHNVIGRFCPAQGTREHLLGEIRERHRHRHSGLRLFCFASEAIFAIDPHR